MQKTFKRENGSIAVKTINTEPSLTQQQFKEECDVNNIIAKYKKTGEFTHLARKSGVYADITKIKDYHSSLQQVLDAQNAFDTLPSHLRNRFQNDPAQLLEFLKDKKNYDEGVKLGILEPIKNHTPPQPNQTPQPPNPTPQNPPPQKPNE